MPNAKCLDGGLDVPRLRFRCYARVDRYAFKIFSEKQDDTRKQTAAQYLMLDRYRR